MRSPLVLWHWRSRGDWYRLGHGHHICQRSPGQDGEVEHRLYVYLSPFSSLFWLLTYPLHLAAPLDMDEVPLSLWIKVCIYLSVLFYSLLIFGQACLDTVWLDRQCRQVWWFPLSHPLLPLATLRSPPLWVPSLAQASRRNTPVVLLSKMAVSHSFPSFLTYIDSTF